MISLLHRPYALWFAFVLCACLLFLLPDLARAAFCGTPSTPACGTGPSTGPSSAKLTAMVLKLNTTLSLIGTSLRNVLYGLAALTVVICGGAAFMGRFPARWLWTVGGGVVAMALGGLAVDLLIADAAVSGNAQVYAVELQ